MPSLDTSVCKAIPVKRYLPKDTCTDKLIFLHVRTFYLELGFLRSLGGCWQVE